MKKASKKLGDWRLEGCTMYVTLEPCQMCAGAAVQARLDRVVIGAMNAKAGCAGSIINLLDMQQFNHQIPITKGVLEQECSQILSEFFKRIRVKKKKRPLTNEEISDTIMDAQPGRQRCLVPSIRYSRGYIPAEGVSLVELPFVSGVEVWVLRNKTL